ncbi:hypothetical protein HMI54_003364 [Coelomomyces lativittatus]|nr:hypothetical protein HMI54_003364 [Coelomomyces lativittatus]
MTKPKLLDNYESSTQSLPTSTPSSPEPPWSKSKKASPSSTTQPMGQNPSPKQKKAKEPLQSMPPSKTIPSSPSKSKAVKSFNMTTSSNLPIQDSTPVASNPISSPSEKKRQFNLIKKLGNRPCSWVWNHFSFDNQSFTQTCQVFLPDSTHCLCEIPWDKTGSTKPMAVHLARVHGLHSSSTIISIPNPGNISLSLSHAMAKFHTGPLLYSDLSLLAKVDEVQEDLDPVLPSLTPLPDPAPSPFPSPDLASSPIPSTSNPPILTSLPGSLLPTPLTPAVSDPRILVLATMDPNNLSSPMVSPEPLSSTLPAPELPVISLFTQDFTP